MNRRSFFGALAAGLATFTLWPRRASALPESVDEITKPRREVTASMLGLSEPVVYEGDKNDPHYFLAGYGPDVTTRELKVTVDGVNVTAAAYECYEGENGWANLHLRNMRLVPRLSYADEGKIVLEHLSQQKLSFARLETPIAFSVRGNVKVIRTH